MTQGEEYLLHSLGGHVASGVKITLFMPEYDIEVEREDDGRWIASIPQTPGCMVYGDTVVQAVRIVKQLREWTLSDP